MIKVGRYQGKVVQQTMGRDKGGGEQIEILLEVAEPGKEHDRERISFFGSFSGDAGPYTIDRMLLCGWKIGEPPSTLVGKPCEFIVREEVWAGKPYLKADIVQPFGELRTPAGSRIAEEAAMAILARAAAQPKPPKRAKGAGASHIDDDDLPPEAYERGAK